MKHAPTLDDIKLFMSARGKKTREAKAREMAESGEYPSASAIQKEMIQVYGRSIQYGKIRAMFIKANSFKSVTTEKPQAMGEPLANTLRQHRDLMVQELQRIANRLDTFEVMLHQLSSQLNSLQNGSVNEALMTKLRESVEADQRQLRIQGIDCTPGES